MSRYSMDGPSDRAGVLKCIDNVSPTLRRAERIRPHATTYSSIAAEEEAPEVDATTYVAAGPSESLPSCPSDISERRWTQFLRRAVKCEVCWTTFDVNVHVGIRHSVCSNCSRDHLVHIDTFRRRFPEYDIAVLELLPHTYDPPLTCDPDHIPGPYDFDDPEDYKCYWSDDIVNMHAGFSTFQEAIWLGLPNASVRMQVFIADRKSRARAMVEHAEQIGSWQARWAQDAQRKDPPSSPHPTPSPSTDRDIAGYRRRFQLHALSRADPAAAVLWRYLTFLKNTKLTRREALYCPPPYMVLIVSPIRELIRRANVTRAVDIPMEAANTPMVAADLELVAREFPACLRDFKLVLVSSLAGKLPPHIISQSRVASPAYLAVAVYWCLQCNHLLFAYEEAALHHHGEPFFTRKVVHDYRASRAVSALLDCLGLGAGFMSPQDLDALDSRFQCSLCPPMYHQATWYTEVMTWRLCVIHYLSCHDYDCEQPSWRHLPTYEERDVKRWELQDARYEGDAWMCGHCTAADDDSDTQGRWAYSSFKYTITDMLHHLQSCHQIQNPVHRVRGHSDYFWAPFEPWLLRSSFYPVDSGSDSAFDELVPPDFEFYRSA